MSFEDDALTYHSSGRKGKVEVVSTKPCYTQRDLALAYTPGVAEPCKRIAQNPDLVYEYTAKGNLVGVITNGTAVLGLGNIGPAAGKPVMEGKGVLFKRFADIDVFDIEVNTQDPEEFVRAIKLLEPTFGGINLEDIKAPECFYIEEELKKTMNIPVFHDDQHGTAIISGAAFINALIVTNKKAEDVHVVFSGGGAAAIACAKLFLSLGVQKKNLLMCDSKGVIYKGRTEGINKYKEEFIVDTKARTLKDAMVDADVFVGVSVKGAVTKDMLKGMAKNPIVFAMANPDPEITYEDALSVRKDVLMATGRSDYPNQVNNVLGFPFIFRGALDVRATAINEEMKIAAVHALAKLAREDVPDSVSRAYGNKKFKFGPEYIIPKPFDHRVLLWVAPAVAEAAMKSGVARLPIKNMSDYREQLERLQGNSRGIIRNVINKVKHYSPEVSHLPSIVFTEGYNEKVLRACQIILEEGVARPIILGPETTVRNKIKELDLSHLKDIEIIQPIRSDKFGLYSQRFHEMRKRRGVTLLESERLMYDPNYFGAMMVHMGHADGLINGVTQSYAESVRPLLRVLGTNPGDVAAGLYIIIQKNRMLFFADTTVNIDPTAEELATIAINSADVAKFFDVSPRIAMLSFSNFGSTRHPQSSKMREAADLVRRRRPDLIVDGEMQADTAVDPNIVKELFPFCEIKDGANVLIFPDLNSGNIAYKLMHKIGNAEAVGPILMGITKPANVMQRSIDVNDLLNMAAITAIQCQSMKQQTNA
ncbi:MAG: NADP-dependent malic enzyme [Oligoflexia bacterium]|nr:NADP-dependent malic enzyme [Oligoflexia bacterium]